MSSDETYLEAFIESLTTLPHEIRRNLDLIKELHRKIPLDQLQTLQRAYIQKAEQKMMQLEIVELPEESDSDSEDDDDADTKQQDLKRSGADEPNNTKRMRYGVRALNDDGITQSPANPVVTPTTEEFMAYTYMAAPYQQIRLLQRDALQKSDETVAVARQAHELVDAVVQRLDADLAAMEKTLLPNEYGGGGSGNGGNNGGSSSGNHASVNGGGVLHENYTAKPDDLAACQVTQGAEWILAKVIALDPNTRIYKLADEDVESNKIFDLPESQVIVLNGIIDRLTKGDVVFAVYPDTTSFYQATVVQAPRKQGVVGQFVMVNFQDDSDEFGVTHDKAVPLQHVMPPP